MALRTVEALDGWSMAERVEFFFWMCGCVRGRQDCGCWKRKKKIERKERERGEEIMSTSEINKHFNQFSLFNSTRIWMLERLGE